MHSLTVGLVDCHIWHLWLIKALSNLLPDPLTNIVAFRSTHRGADPTTTDLAAGRETHKTANPAPHQVTFET